MKLVGALTSREGIYGLGWALVSLGSMVSLGFGWGCVIGGACLFLTAVFGIAPSRGGG